MYSINNQWWYMWQKNILQFQYCTCGFLFFYVCSPNVIALVLGLFETLRHNVPKY